MSSEAHARILNVDSSEALSMPGVVDYICKNDVQGSNPIEGLAKNRDGEIFAEELVRLFIYLYQQMALAICLL